WVEAKGRVEHDTAGAPARMSGVFLNITARKQADVARAAALEESVILARRVAAIVESTDDAIVSKDLNGVVAPWNPSAERMFGYSAKEAIGRSIALIIPDDRLAEETMVLSRIRAGESVKFETVRRRKDGSSIDISLTVSPIFNAQGRVVGASKI